MQHVPDIFTYLQSRALRASCSSLSKKSLNISRITLYSSVKHTEHTQQFQVLRNLLFKWVTGSETNYGKNKDILDIQELAYKLKNNLTLQ